MVMRMAVAASGEGDRLLSLLQCCSTIAVVAVVEKNVANPCF